MIGVNTAQSFAFKGGRVRSRRVAEVERELATATPEQFRIVVAHHHLTRPKGVQEAEHSSWGAARASRRLAAGIDVVLSGHLHQTLELYPAGSEAFPALHTGTSSSSRGRGPEASLCPHQWIEVGVDAFTVACRAWQGDTGDFRTTGNRRFPRRRGR